MKTKNQIGPLLLSIQMIVDMLISSGNDFKANTVNDLPIFEAFNIFDGQNTLYPDILYYLPKGTIGFPSDRFSYISTEDIEGNAPHVCCVDMDETSCINLVINTFQKYRDFEIDLNSIISNNGSLTDLCMLANDFFKNPTYIHDYMFCIIALPQYVNGMRNFDVDLETGKSFIPLWLINNFKFDKEYQNTLSTHNAAIWGSEQFDRNNRCMYVNIWDGTFYMGRLIIEEMTSMFTKSQFYVAEYFCAFAKVIMLRDLCYNNPHNDFDELFKRLTDNADYSNEELQRFLSIKGWLKEDLYLCIKTGSQRSGISIKTDALFRSKYSEFVKEFYCFQSNAQTCVVVNLTKSHLSVAEIKRNLAPLVRESYLYCGISNSFSDIKNIYQGFKQADIALDYIRRYPSEWILEFRRCILNWLISNDSLQFSPDMLIPTVLKDLYIADLKRGSSYYETLKCFIINERDIPKVSEILAIHRTTLLYRLEKINSMIKLDLDDADIRLYLLICFKLMDLQYNG